MKGCSRCSSSILHRRIVLNCTSEDVGGVLQQLPLPIGDLLGMQLKLLAQFGYCLVLSSRSAARATRTLKVAVWVRRVRRADFLTIRNSFSPELPRPSFMPRVSTYNPVQICGATSQDHQRSGHCTPKRYGFSCFNSEQTPLGQARHTIYLSCAQLRF